jgi:hypothetical protein
MCGSNNYFGLSFHPEVLEAAHKALDSGGTGTTGSRAANGTFSLHRDLELTFADLYGKRKALVFTTGYQANLGVIAGLCGPEDVVMADMESHASIYDGARLSGAQLFAFRHNSPSDLARKLARVPDPGSIRSAGTSHRSPTSPSSAGRREPISWWTRRTRSAPTGPAASGARKPRASSIKPISSWGRSRRRCRASAATAYQTMIS